MGSNEWIGLEWCWVDEGGFSHILIFVGPEVAITYHP